MEENTLEFTHLHVHTEYSLLDGSAKITEIVARAKELGMKNVAITDHGAMYGVMEFYKEAKENGIKPILGCEVYVAPDSRFKKDNNSNTYYHLVLLAENTVGYQNLIKIVSAGFLEGFYYKPRVDIELLEKYHEGIIALSACLAGPVAKNILQVSYEKAKEIAVLYENIFGQGNFYLELQDHGMSEQKTVNQALVRMNKETNIPLVATNDSHYIYKEDSKAHDILLCIQTGKSVNDQNRMRYEGSEFYFKSQEEMYKLFPYAQEALENTNKIADRCNVDFTFHELKLPKYHVPAPYSANEYLRKLCSEGFENRYDEQQRSDLSQRLEYELSVIETMGYVDYFLIVWDFIKFSKDNGIMVGPGRGSAAGSIVSYCLQITNIDPIKYNLLFERFLNPERVSMPDIDIDFCYERRQEVIDYVTQKYGQDRVAQIVTFGTMAAKAAIRDVGRALDMPYAEVDKVAKMIPTELGITIQKALDMNKELSDLYEEQEDVKNLIDMSLRLEGLPRHSSTHAAGVLICDEPVVNYVPLSASDGSPTTQFTMTVLEKLGLLKMDFLGLRTLTVIQNAVNEIKRIHGIGIDIDKIDFEDKQVYSLISQAKTEGVFQLESAGMKQFMKELQPSSLEDIIAGISLYRPGPMDFIPKYIKGKNNPEDIRYTHDALKPILDTTYGCIVYQEQVMQIFRDLGGYSLGRSDLIRSAMSKKKTEVMAKERQVFIFGEGSSVEGCVKNGVPKEIAEKIYDEMIDFAKYAFNKSHAAAYAVVSYQTAWLKTHYPVEFMAALMTSVLDSTSKVVEYIEVCKKMNIEILPPDINEGYTRFSVSNGKIVYALASIKNVGRPAINSMVLERTENGKFTGITDFCERLSQKDLNKRGIENLIKAGAFDCLGGNRMQYMSVYKQIIDSIGNDKKKNIEGQINLFDIGAGNEKAVHEDSLPKLEEYSLKMKLSMEKEVLGMYISGHPLSEYQQELSKYITVSSLDFVDTYTEGLDSLEDDTPEKLVDGENVAIGGLLIEKTIKYTRSNKAMAFIKIEDLYGVIEVILFPDMYSKYSTLLLEETVLYIQGRANVQEDADSKVIASKIMLYEDLINGNNKPTASVKTLENKPEGTLWLKLSEDKPDGILDEVSKILGRYAGNTQIIIYEVKTKKKFKAPQNLFVTISDELIAELTNLLGEECVVIRD
jgi:DNA polymerase-3 subunit alpha